MPRITLDVNTDLLQYTGASKTITARIPLTCLDTEAKIVLCQDLVKELLLTDALNADDHQDLGNYIIEACQIARPNHPGLSEIQKKDWYK